ncbi:hypothetical protein DACRYDRAFT_21491 [Dacryopinax primogenitus]|uniref:Uncharacterized protein n=1 Tax=Dacryopinax primogenitus (strain DJM 731) TaxID=1858805 RepID=M5G3J7_DACPD|nr:uncharacterized protein DACRYDRAFT_21491 [Dacryopinax primogenitus]EJU03249.1 hypothetical protein DACRYDRAFT_21491 [Dacryopinax primogenitus]
MLGAPNTILCEPFARYAARLCQTSDPEKYPDGFAACVQLLMQKASIIDAGRDEEDDRRKRLEPGMQQILKCELEDIQDHHSESGAEGHSRVTLSKFGHISADILVVEYKSEVGAGPAEPSFQVQLTARKGWAQETNALLCEASNCPVLLITLIGPFLQVSGVVFQPAASVNQFTDNLSLTLDTDDFQRIDRLCHVLWCTQQCAEDLQTYYSELEPPAENHAISVLPYMPYSRRCGDYEIRYVSHLENTRHQQPMYMAKATGSDGQETEVVVKFTRRYSCLCTKRWRELGSLLRCLRSSGLQEGRSSWVSSPALHYGRRS